VFLWVVVYNPAARSGVGLGGGGGVWGGGGGVGGGGTCGFVWGGHVVLCGGTCVSL